MNHIGTLSTGGIMLLAIAASACNEPDETRAEATSAEVTSAVATLPNKAAELSEALGRDEPGEVSEEDCASGNCGPPMRGSGPGMGGPMMMPMPGRAMMGSPGGQSSESGESSMGALTDQPSTQPLAGASQELGALHRSGADDFFLDQAEELQLTTEQRGTLGSIRERATVALAEAERESEASEERLWILTAADRPDIEEITEQVRQLAQITAQRRGGYIASVAQAVRVLTDAQRGRLNSGAGVAPTDAMAMGTPEPMGMDRMGMNAMGMDRMGMNAMGMDRMGMNGMGMDRMGMDRMGMRTSAGSGSEIGSDMEMGSSEAQGAMEMGSSEAQGAMEMDSNDAQDHVEMGMRMMGQNPARTAQSPTGLTSSLPGFPGVSHFYHVGATGFFLDHPDHVTLTDNQQRELTQVQSQTQEAIEEIDRRISGAEHDLFVLTSRDTLDSPQVEAAIERIAQLYMEARLTFIQAVGSAASLLTDEQRQTLVGRVPLDEAHGAPPMGQ